jgi:hypothetical protein
MSAHDTEHFERIRIADLADPILTDAQRSVIEATANIEVELSVEAVLESASEKTGLTDFGAPDFRERLGVWLQAVGEDASLRPVARLGVFNECVRYASNRARLHKLLADHPEIHDVEIVRPIIVAGLPRSGTTHLLNLIASDERLRSLPYWESLEPVPDPNEPAGPGGEDPRVLRCRAESEVQDTMMPLLKSMHHMTPEHVHEEIELQANDFSSYILEWKAHVPRWRDYYLAHDQAEHYEYLKTSLKALQWLRGPDRWILKSPQHMEQLPVLYNSRRDDRHHASRSGFRDRVYGDDDGLRRQDSNDEAGPAGRGPVLDRPHRENLESLRSRSPRRARGSIDRRALSRFHGRQRGHRSEDLRFGRVAFDRRCARFARAIRRRERPGAQGSSRVRPGRRFRSNRGRVA